MNARSTLNATIIFSLLPGPGRVVVTGLLAAVLGLAAAGLQPLPATADRTAPAHYCRAPTVPEAFRDAGHEKQFGRDFDYYKQCIQDYARKHADQAKVHQGAADKANKEWAVFVKKAEKVWGTP